MHPAAAALLLWLNLAHAESQEPTVDWQASLVRVTWDLDFEIEPTADGGYIVCGTSVGQRQDALLWKLSESGETVWREVYGTSFQDGCSSVKQTSDGGFIACGWSEPVRDGSSVIDVYLFKTATSGALQWERTFGEIDELERGESVLQTDDGGFLVCTVDSGDNGSVYLIKTSPEGNFEWDRSVGRGTGCCMQRTEEGGYTVCGASSSFGASTDVYLLKLSPSFEVEWEGAYGGERAAGASAQKRRLDARLRHGGSGTSAAGGRVGPTSCSSLYIRRR